MTDNMWNKLAYINVTDVAMINLLGLIVTNWPVNCSVSCRVNNDIKNTVN